MENVMLIQEPDVEKETQRERTFPLQELDFLKIPLRLERTMTNVLAEQALEGDRMPYAFIP